MIQSLLKISSGFGLSSAAGLNAYIPLLLLSIMANRGLIHLSPGYEVLQSPWTIAVLAILCVIELVVDKIPGADHVNDILQTFIRPTSGALLFGAETGTIAYIQPAVFIIAGIAIAGTVHAAKALSRPVINMTTFGIGAPVASTMEDLASTVVSLAALLFPILALFLIALCGWFFYKTYKRFTGKKHPIPINARPVPENAPDPAMPPAA